MTDQTKTDARRQSAEAQTAEREIAAVRDLLESLGALAADDDELRIDVIEGETGLLEIFGKLIESSDEDQMLIDGIKARQGDLAARSKRLAGRVEMRRALIEKGLSIANLKTVTLPTATITLSRRPASLVINEEAEIPSQYFKPGKPTLDKKALLDDLKAKADDDDQGDPIPGACLSNGGQSVTIRRK